VRGGDAGARLLGAVWAMGGGFRCFVLAVRRQGASSAKGNKFKLAGFIVSEEAGGSVRQTARGVGYTHDIIGCAALLWHWAPAVLPSWLPGCLPVFLAACLPSCRLPVPTLLPLQRQRGWRHERGAQPRAVRRAMEGGFIWFIRAAPRQGVSSARGGRDRMLPVRVACNRHMAR
jgi:hypothetical protein